MSRKIPNLRFAIITIAAIITLASDFADAQTPTIPRIEFVQVRGGKFRMGCPSHVEGCLADERPVHEVKLDDFFLSKYPITQAQWVAVMGRNPSHFQSNDQRPVEQVSWTDVQEFIRRLNAMTGMTYRLPTEAEWEYAAQGGRHGPPRHPRPRRGRMPEREYLADSAWFNFNSGGTTHPVGQKKPNALGLYDMQGNVWEWVNDRYDRDYYRTSPVKNPRGPLFGNVRVYRGNSFLSEERHIRVSARNFAQENYRAIYIGFRLAL